MSLDDEILEAFWAWTDSQDSDFGDTYEDYGPWFECFAAGYKVGRDVDISD